MSLSRLKWWPTPATDEEHIALVRKRVARSRWYALGWAIGAAYFLGVAYWSWHMSRVIGAVFSSVPAHMETYSLIGVIFGFFAGKAIAFATANVFMLVETCTGQRTERLMLRYHDELARRDQPAPPPTA